MFDVGSGELMVIMVAALLLFGKRLPEVARSVGRSMAEVKRGLGESTRPLREVQADFRRQIAEAGSDAGGGGAPPAPGEGGD